MTTDTGPDHVEREPEGPDHIGHDHMGQARCGQCQHVFDTCVLPATVAAAVHAMKRRCPICNSGKTFLAEARALTEIEAAARARAMRNRTPSLAAVAAARDAPPPAPPPAPTAHGEF